MGAMMVVIDVQRVLADSLWQRKEDSLRSGTRLSKLSFSADNYEFATHMLTAVSRESKSGP